MAPRPCTPTALPALRLCSGRSSLQSIHWIDCPNLHSDRSAGPSLVLRAFVAAIDSLDRLPGPAVRPLCRPFACAPGVRRCNRFTGSIARTCGPTALPALRLRSGRSSLQSIHWIDCPNLHSDRSAGPSLALRAFVAAIDSLDRLPGPAVRPLCRPFACAPGVRRCNRFTGSIARTCGPTAPHPLLFRRRDFSRFQSRAFSVSRLSCNFLPLPSASSILARP